MASLTLSVLTVKSPVLAISVAVRQSTELVAFCGRGWVVFWGNGEVLVFVDQ